MNKNNKNKSSKKLLTGQVIRTSTPKTALVEIKVAKVHPLYHKRFFKTTRYLVHDPENQAKVGDLVAIREVRPVSKNKHWQIVKKVEK
jgi:small subunit ribosomal protein S17